MPEHANFFPADVDYDALAAECVKMLPRGLDQLEIMLRHGKFLQNADEVSIADLRLVCELTQLQVGYICTIQLYYFFNSRMHAQTELMKQHVTHFFLGLCCTNREHMIIYALVVEAMEC